jgi:hypothetical protein
MEPLPPSRAQSFRLAEPRLDEDLSGNLARVSEIAERHCQGCADYHVGFVARRLVRQRTVASSDRHIFAQLTAERLAASATAEGPIEVLIAGSADSGLAAIVAKAAMTVGHDVFARVHMTVVDRCNTPLELVRSYALSAGIAATVVQIDLLQSKRRFDSDLICVHSLFRHIERKHHSEILGRMAQWLKPGGAIVFSSRVGVEGRDVRFARSQEESAALSLVTTLDTLSLSESTATLAARMERDWEGARYAGEYESLDALNETFRESGLAIVHQQTKPSKRGSGRKFVTLAVLERAIPPCS